MAEGNPFPSPKDPCTPSGYLGLATIRGSPGQPLAHFTACTGWCITPVPRQKAYSQAERPTQ